jgi:protoporphyrin/coproporphyrin ferrochelatase
MDDQRDRKPGADAEDTVDDPMLSSDDEADEDVDFPDDDDQDDESITSVNDDSDEPVEISVTGERVPAAVDDDKDEEDEPEEQPEKKPAKPAAKKASERKNKEAEAPEEVIGVLLMAYGGPDKLDDVPDYLLDVRSGRPMAQELVDEFVERYREIGGRSPILELTQAQAAGVEKALNNRKAKESGIQYKAYVGMRHWDPYIRDVVPQIVEDGVDKLVGVVMAPHYSKMSVGKYMEQMEEGMEKASKQIPMLQVESWKDQPMFISGVASRIRDALRKFPGDVRKDVPIVFTAHSLPTRILEWGDPYPDELRVSVEMVADRVRQRHWRFAYQSQGATNEPWLGPDVETTLDELAAEGFKDVLIVPIGFVCDHVEILYDVDIEHKEHAEKLGMHLERIKSLNDGPMLCRAVAESVRKVLFPTEPSEETEEAEELAGVGASDED